MPKNNESAVAPLPPPEAPNTPPTQATFDWRERVGRIIDHAMRLGSRGVRRAVRDLLDEYDRLPAAPPAQLDVTRILRRVAELPDRTSPADWPEAMIVTADELRNILTDELAAPLAHQETAAFRLAERLTEIIWWMLGERDALPERPEPLAGRWARNFWWRGELRKRFEGASQDYLVAKSAASGAPPARQEHFCGGCHHRWEGDLTGVELCGDCWRKAQAVVHGAPPAPPDKLANLCETCKSLLPFSPNPPDLVDNGCWQCAHQAYMAKLEAALAASPAPRWQPMADMPESGQVIVCWATDLNGETSYDTIGKAEYLEVLDYGEPPASGWMPLSAPPVAASVPPDQKD